MEVISLRYAKLNISTVRHHEQNSFPHSIAPDVEVKIRRPYCAKKEMFWMSNRKVSDRGYRSECLKIQLNIRAYLCCFLHFRVFQEIRLAIHEATGQVEEAAGLQKGARGESCNVVRNVYKGRPSRCHAILHEGSGIAVVVFFVVGQ